MYRQDTAVNKGLKAITKMYEGKRQYELSNHLENVLTVISDRRTYTISGTTKIYDAVVLSAQDYYPFGLSIDSRSFVASATNSYRYSFNGKEDDGEWNKQDYGARIYDKRLGKFISIDPLTKKYPFYSPYQFAGNMPIKFIDLDGAEPFAGGRDYPKVKSVGDAGEYITTLLYNGTLGAVGDMLNGGAALMDHAAKNGLGTTGAVTLTHLEKSLDNTIDYHMNTPANEQLSEVGRAFKNPKNYEFVPSLFLGGYVSKMLKPSLTNSSLKVVSTMSLEEISNTRITLAWSYFQKSNVSQDFSTLNKLMNSIDFGKQVFTKDLKVGELLYRWELPGVSDAKHFFTDKTGIKSASSVGLKGKGYKLVTYEVTKETNVLESTIKGSSTKQFFSTELEKYVKPK
jgi:RHS repeat-associated protein